jgi:hypothetical protein
MGIGTHSYAWAFGIGGNLQVVRSGSGPDSFSFVSNSLNTLSTDIFFFYLYNAIFSRSK